MAILAAAFLINPAVSIYNYPLGIIMHDKIDTMLNQMVMEKGYSIDLANTIQKMLIIDPFKRIGYE